MSVDIRNNKEWLILIENIGTKEGLNNISIEVISQTPKGEGFLGNVAAITVTDKRSEKVLNLILKSAHTDVKLRSQLHVDKIYLREIYMYKTLLPDFFEFQKKAGILNPFTGFAKLYGTSTLENNEIIIMEDLKQGGYKLWNRKLPMNSEHISLVLKEYGKFNAISLAMRKLSREKYEQLTEDLNNNIVETGPFVELLLTSLRPAVSSVQENFQAKTVFEKCIEQIEKFVKEDLVNKEDFVVVLHGDCWSNNMMFKYEDHENPKTPTKVCFLDWQLSRIGSPVLDLSHFFLSCSSREILYDYKKYLKIYHDTVADNLKNFGCDPEEIFPYSLLEAHWKKYSKYGLMVFTMVIKGLLNEDDEADDFTELANSDKGLFGGMNFKPRNEAEYKKRLCDVAVFMLENDFI